MKRLLAGAGVIVACLLVPFLARPAGAEISGPCTASIAGTDVKGVSSSNPSDAIEVDKDAVVPVTSTSTAPITGYTVQMEYGGIRWTVASGKGDGTGWSSTVKVKNYSRYGTGLYKVIGKSSGPGACSGAALIKVTGKSPLTTAAGAGSAVILAAGLVGLIHSVIVAGSDVLGAV
jgi:hypothetical protein